MKTITKLLLLLITFGISYTTYAQNEQQPDAPLYRDPITDGAADPVVIYNHMEKAWWMLYTQRRANTESADVAYCYGNKIGIAYSTDNGKSWRYRGSLDLEFERGENTFWAPDIVEFNGVYHLFVAYTQGVGIHWGGEPRLIQYTSSNLWDWKYEGEVKLAQQNVIDPSLIQKPDGSWRMFYKWNSQTAYADSQDLIHWVSNPHAVITDQAHEGDKVFKFQGSYWDITDQWAGLGVYKSSDLETWTKQKSTLLSTPSNRPDDKPSGAHCDVVVVKDKAYIFYFTHPGRIKHTETQTDSTQNIPYAQRRSSIQVAELEVINGLLQVKDRDKPFGIYLPNK